MTYIEFINKFWKLDEEYQFSCCETRLFFYLLKSFNAVGWKDILSRSDDKVYSDIGVSVNVFKMARKRLKESGLIVFRNGNGRGEKTVYELVKGYDKGIQNLTPLPYLFQEKSPIPPKEEYKIKTKKEPPKGGKKESSFPNLFPTPKLIKSKPVKSYFIAPTLEKVESYFLSIQADKKLDDWKNEAAIFFNHYDSIGWRNANGVKIEHWESKANLWVLDHAHKKSCYDRRGNGTICPNRTLAHPLAGALARGYLLHPKNRLCSRSLSPRKSAFKMAENKDGLRRICYRYCYYSYIDWGRVDNL